MPRVSDSVHAFPAIPVQQNISDVSELNKLKLGGEVEDTQIYLSQSSAKIHNFSFHDKNASENISHQ